MQQVEVNERSGLAGRFGVGVVLLDASEHQHAQRAGEAAHLELGDGL